MATATSGPDPGKGNAIGLLGSAFNPPHLGHLVLAGEARWRLGLEQVLLVPTGDPYHKEVVVDPGPAVRLALVEAAIRGQVGLSVSAIEIGRDGPSYTCDTLEQIAKLNPDSEIHLLMGADAALGFGDWRRPERILELARVAVAPREGAAREEAVALKGVEPVFEGLGAGDRLELIGMPPVGISSTLVQDRLRKGEPYRHLVPVGVAEMIESEELYGE